MNTMYETDDTNIHETASALADGHLRGDAFAAGVDAVATDPAGREAWHRYHLIGDVLRSGELARGTPPVDFMSRLQVRLRLEHGVSPVDGHGAGLASTGEPFVGTLGGSAANDSVFRWKLLAGVATLAAVAVVAWSVAGVSDTRPGASQMAAAQPEAAASSQSQVMIRDPRLDELLAAHRQLGGATALQAPAGFLRNATFEGPAR